MLLLKNNPRPAQLRAPLGCCLQGRSRQDLASQVQVAGKSSARPSATHPAPRSHHHAGATSDGDWRGGQQPPPAPQRLLTSDGDEGLC